MSGAEPALLPTDFGVRMTVGDLRRLQLGAEHVVALGPRLVAHLLADLARGGAGLPVLLEQLDTLRGGVTPELVRALGADRFPPLPLKVVS